MKKNLEALTEALGVQIARAISAASSGRLRFVLLVFNPGKGGSERLAYSSNAPQSTIASLMIEVGQELGGGKPEPSPTDKDLN